MNARDTTHFSRDPIPMRKSPLVKLLAVIASLHIAAHAETPAPAKAPKEKPKRPAAVGPAIGENKACLLYTSPSPRDS